MRIFFTNFYMIWQSRENKKLQSKTALSLTAYKLICPIILLLWGLLAGPLHAQDQAPDADPVQQWKFGSDSVKGNELIAAHGGLGGKVLGTFNLVDQGELSYMELAPAKKVEGVPDEGGILLTTDHSKAGLPVGAMTVEAWVQLDSTLEWGGIIGAVRDTGVQEAGWILGYRLNRFCFGLATEQTKRITYLNSKSSFVLKAWYHLVASYDGVEKQQLYVDGKLSAQSNTQRGAMLQPTPLFYTIGAYRDDDDYYPFNGKIAGVAVWHRELKAEEITARFEQRKSKFPGIEPVSPVRPGTDNEWATWMSDNLRSGRAPGSVRLHPSGKPRWVYHPARPPMPAWPETARSDHWRHRTGPETPKVTFDWVYDVAVAENRLFFGSSSDDGIRCLDANTGRLLWRFSAGGPVRLAPTVSNGWVLFGCDDGAIYSLNAKDGALRWKTRPKSIPDRRLPGNGRLMSVWPVRTGILVNGLTGYFGAGLFPGEGAYYCSVDLRDGRIIDEKEVNFSPQGYIFENGGELFAQAGRTNSSALFGRVSNGRKQYAPLINRVSKVVRKRFPYALIDTQELVVAGGEDQVAAFKPGTDTPVWQAQVDGSARGLAVAGEQLFVSTTKGTIYAFGLKPDQTVHQERNALEQPAREVNKRNAEAQRLIEKLPRKRGYALVVGIGNGSLIKTLAERTQLHVVGVDTDGQHIARLRRKFIARNLYGSLDNGPGQRGSVALQEVKDFSVLPFVDGIFNLVTNGLPGVTLPPQELRRLLRPWDGIAAFGSGAVLNGEAPVGAGSWTHAYANTGNTASSGEQRSDGNMRLRWFGRPGPDHIVDRHLRASPPLAASGYLLVPGRDYLFGLDAHNGSVLWEREIPMFTRASMLRDCGNLAIEPRSNRVFAVSGPDCLFIDADTGSTLRKMSVNFANEEWGYLAVSDGILVGSAVSKGAVRRELSHAAIYEGGYGDSKRTVCSRRMFAVESKSGGSIWNYRPRGAITNPSICIESGTVFFLESGNTNTLDVPGTKKEGQANSSAPGRLGYDELISEKGANLIALNLRTGVELWRRPFGTALSDIQTFYLTASGKFLVAVHSRNAVPDPEPTADLQPLQEPDAKPVLKKPTLYYGIEVMDVGDGSVIWEHEFDTGRNTNLTHGEQDLHPVITGGRLIVEPKVFDLTTGKNLFNFVRQGGGGCGTISASANKLYYRASNPAEFDLEKKQQRWISRATRPGCWINMIPANGLLLVPEGSSGCICGFPVQASMAYGTEPDTEE